MDPQPFGRNYFIGQSLRFSFSSILVSDPFLTFVEIFPCGRQQARALPALPQGQSRSHCEDCVLTCGMSIEPNTDGFLPHSSRPHPVLPLPSLPALRVTALHSPQASLSALHHHTCWPLFSCFSLAHDSVKYALSGHKQHKGTQHTEGHAVLLHRKCEHQGGASSPSCTHLIRYESKHITQASPFSFPGVRQTDSKVCGKINTPG